jgi:hypothetical protein
MLEVTVAFASSIDEPCFLEVTNQLPNFSGHAIDLSTGLAVISFQGANFVVYEQSCLSRMHSAMLFYHTH